MPRKYYPTATTLAADWTVATNELSATASPPGSDAAIPSQSVNALNNVIHCAWTTPAGAPNDANWAAYTYTFVVDATTSGSTLTLTAAPSKVVAAGTSDVEGTVSAASTVGTGLKTLTSTFDFAAGLATDRFGVQLLAANSSSMSAATIGLTARADGSTYFEGPWGGVATAATQQLSYRFRTTDTETLNAAFT